MTRERFAAGAVLLVTIRSSAGQIALRGGTVPAAHDLSLEVHI